MSQEDKNILNCPICEGECHSQGKKTGHWKIICKDCGLTSPDTYYNENAAIKYWNSRPDLKGEEMQREKKIELGKTIHKHFPYAISSLKSDQSCVDVANIALNKIEDIRVKSERIDPDKEKKADEIAKSKGLVQEPRESLKIFQKEIDAPVWVKANLDPHQPTPNCSICQWRRKTDKTNIPHFEELSEVLSNIGVCIAQGDRYIKSVYGNKICKRLYQETESVTKQIPTNEAK